MIATVPDMSAESGIDCHTIHAYLAKWRKRGWSNPTGKLIHATGGGRGRPSKMHFVRDYVWDRFMRDYTKRKKVAPEMKYRPALNATQWRCRYLGILTQYRYRSYRLHNIAIVLPYINERGEQQ